MRNKKLAANAFVVWHEADRHGAARKLAQAGPVGNEVESTENRASDKAAVFRRREEPTMTMWMWRDERTPKNESESAEEAEDESEED